MLRSPPTTTPIATSLPVHRFAYPRVSQIAPRAHTVLASSLRATVPKIVK